MYFYVSNSEPPGCGQFGTNLVENHLAMLHTEFQASEPSVSEKKGF